MRYRSSCSGCFQVLRADLERSMTCGELHDELVAQVLFDLTYPERPMPNPLPGGKRNWGNHRCQCRRRLRYRLPGRQPHTFRGRNHGQCLLQVTLLATATVIAAPAIELSVFPEISAQEAHAAVGGLPILH